MGFVLEIKGNDMGSGGVASGHGLPGRDPVVLGEAALAVPQVVHESVVGQGVVVEDDHEAESTGLGDDGVHHLDRGLALEVSIAAVGIVDAGCGRR